jgi:DNA-binding transcriptional ArsR family regulator
MKVSAETRRAIFKAKADKVSIKDICEKFSLSKATVHRVLKAEPGLEIREIEVKTTIPVLNDFENKSIEFAKILQAEAPVEPINAKKEKVSKKDMDDLINQVIGSSDDVDEVKEGGPSAQRPRSVSFSQPSRRDLAQMMEEPEDVDLHNQLEQKIILNIQNFAPIFHFIRDKDAFIKSLHDKKNSELRGILTTLETTRTTVNLSNQMKQMFFMASKGVEVGGAMFLKLRTEGFTDSLVRQQQELDMIFREIAIEYAPMFKMTNKPELRLAMVFTMTLIQTDSMNRLKETFSQQQNRQPNTADNNSPEQKYEDL